MFDSMSAVPAPWNLTGSGYILMFKFNRTFISNQANLSPQDAAAYAGGLGWVMLVDYQTSDAGPYREMLFIPGKFRWQGARYYSISTIYVSTAASVVNGRSNWGIPKQLADFTVTPEDEHTERFSVSLEGQPIADFRLRSFGPELAVTSRLFPARPRTLVQNLEGRTYLTTPGGSGSVQPAQLLSADIDGQHFPDIRGARLLAAVRASNFRLTFPTAHITAGELLHAD